tara:strand:- start:3859 stop:4779 length:921 start_codon:yes stop_codon:yes gene_type:complete
MTKINITVQLTNNENIVKFVANSFLTQAKSYEFTNIDSAKPSPIAQELFYLPFVKTIYISQNFIAIEKFPTDLTQIKWEDVQNNVAETIEDYLSSGKPVIIEPEEKEKTSKKIPITIYAESTPNPEVLKFVANRSIANTTYEFKNKNESIYAPLANELFNFPFVKEVFINNNYVSVTKQNGFEWQEFANELRDFIRTYIESGKKIFTDEILQKGEQTNKLTEEREYSDIDKEIISILNEYVKPAVEADGGNIAFDSYDKNTKTVKVILQGACSGCPSSTVTLKNGIEAMLTEMLNGKVTTVEAING